MKHSLLLLLLSFVIVIYQHLIRFMHMVQKERCGEFLLQELKEGLNDPNAPFGVDLLLPQVGSGARATNYDYTGGDLPELIDITIATLRRTERKYAHIYIRHIHMISTYMFKFRGILESYVYILCICICGQAHHMAFSRLMSGFVAQVCRSEHGHRPQKAMATGTRIGLSASAWRRKVGSMASFTALFHGPSEAPGKVSHPHFCAV